MRSCRSPSLPHPPQSGTMTLRTTSQHPYPALVERQATTPTAGLRKTLLFDRGDSDYRLVESVKQTFPASLKLLWSVAPRSCARPGQMAERRRTALCSEIVWSIDQAS